MICSRDEKYMYKWEHYKGNHAGFEEISSKESQSFQNTIIGYTELPENKIKI